MEDFTRTKKYILGFTSAFIALSLSATSFATNDNYDLSVFQPNLNSIQDYGVSLTDLELQCETIMLTYCERFPNQENIICSTINDLIEQEEFIAYYASNQIEALHLIEDTLNDALTENNYDQPITISSFSLSSGRYYLPRSTPTIDQLCYNPYTNEEILTFCGPACVLQALIGNGKLSNITANQTPAKIYEVGVAMGSNSLGTEISNITSYMQNYYTSTSFTYRTKAFTQYSYKKAIEYVKYSLKHNNAVIMRVFDTLKFGYYNEFFRHYVTIIEYNSTNQTLKVVDPNYNSSYQGQFTITLDEFESVMMGDGWLSVFSNDSGTSYEYIY